MTTFNTEKSITIINIDFKYDIHALKKTIAGRNINEYNLKWWRHHCGVAMQDGVIFSEFIARNIAVDDGDIDLARLE